MRSKRSKPSKASKAAAKGWETRRARESADEAKRLARRERAKAKREGTGAPPAAVPEVVMAPKAPRELSGWDIVAKAAKARQRAAERTETEEVNGRSRPFGLAEPPITEPKLTRGFPPSSPSVQRSKRKAPARKEAERQGEPREIPLTRGKGANAPPERVSSPKAPPLPPAQRVPSGWDKAAAAAKVKFAAAQAIQADRKARETERVQRAGRKAAVKTESAEVKLSPPPPKVVSKGPRNETAWQRRIRLGAEKGYSKSQATGKPKRDESSAAFLQDMRKAAKETAHMGPSPERNQITRDLLNKLRDIGAISSKLSVQQQARQFAQFWDDMGWGDYDDASELYWAEYEDAG